MSKVPKLSPGEVSKLLKNLEKSHKGEIVPPTQYIWQLVKRPNEFDTLSRRFKFKSFEDTWAFLTKVSMRAHLLGHHPKITTFYNIVDMDLTTDDVKGLTPVDFKMANRFTKFAQKLGEKYD